MVDNVDAKRVRFRNTSGLEDTGPTQPQSNGK